MLIIAVFNIIINTDRKARRDKSRNIIQIQINYDN